MFELILDLDGDEYIYKMHNVKHQVLTTESSNFFFHKAMGNLDQGQ